MPDDDLRGGTETGRVTPFAASDQGGTGGNSNAASPAGTSHDTGEAGGRGTRNDADSDAAEVFDDQANRHRSHGEAKQFARDEANVGTQPGTPDGGQGRVQQIDRPATG